MAEAGKVIFTIAADASQFKTAMGEAKNSVAGFKDGTVEGAAGMEAWIGKAALMSTAALGVAAGVGMLIKQFGEAADRLLDLSNRTGIAAGNLKTLQDQCIATGTSFDTVSLALDVFNKNLGATGEEAIKVNDSLKNIGVSTTGKTVSEVFQDTVTALQNIKDPSERAAQAFGLFGKGYKEILDLSPDAIKALSNTGKEVDALTLKLIAQKKAADTLNGAINSLTNFIGEGLGRAIDTVTMQGNYMYSDYLTVGDAAFQSMYKMTKQQYEATDAFAKKQAEATKELDKANASQKETVKIAEQAAKAQEEAAASTTKASAAVKQLSADWAAGAVGSPGSNMQLFMQAEMDKGQSYAQALESWRQGAPSNNPGAAYTAGGQGMTSSPKEEKEVETVQKNLSKQVEAYESSYAKIDALTLKHYAALSDMEFIYYTALMKHHQQSTDYISNAVQWIQQITVVDGVASAQPQHHVAEAPPALERADYSKVEVVGGGAAASSKKEGAVTTSKGGGADYTNIIVTVEAADTLKASATVAEGAASNVGIAGGNF